ncbi:2,5-diketo-D-gluconate reductase A [Leucobacter exalbidus]|uniref:2,5-diketo-D-gluconate reductase A n=1 Tax=Leucobacter exalbidus TaxID=662960 RepID=A0A940PNN8_9MICO|nr:2,5-diketo-D-gluconate reductase A [Leucobacter exalbidus]
MIPQLGVGTYLIEPEHTERVVSEAFKAGYRHIDTASFYQNEPAVGAAVKNSGIARNEIFITTKLWNTDQTRGVAAFEESLDRLGLDRVDLFLIHWPQPVYGEALTAWRSLIEIAQSGRSTAIGVSNFEISDLQELIDETGVVPAVNQIELHPFHQRRELRAFCADHGIAVEAWGPLARGRTDLLERPEVTAAAQALGKSPAQIVLRWHVQQDRIIFPKTTRRERLIENAQLFDFELSIDQMAAIDALEEARNLGPDPRTDARR